MGWLAGLAVGAAPDGSRWWRSAREGTDLELALAGAAPDPEAVAAGLAATGVEVEVVGDWRVAVRLTDRMITDEVTRLAVVGNRRCSTDPDPWCSAPAGEGRTASDRLGPGDLAALLGARPDWPVRRTPDNPVFALLHTRARAARTVRAAPRHGVGEAARLPAVGSGRALAVALLVGEEGSAYGLRGIPPAYAGLERAGPLLPRGPEEVGDTHRQAVTLAAATVGALDPILAEYGVGAPERI